jgi:hypothetical protein
LLIIFPIKWLTDYIYCLHCVKFVQFIKIYINADYCDATVLYDLITSQRTLTGSAAVFETLDAVRGFGVAQPLAPPVSERAAVRPQVRERASVRAHQALTLSTNRSVGNNFIVVMIIMYQTLKKKPLKICF